MEGNAPQKAPKRKKRKRTYPSAKNFVCTECGQKFYWQCKLTQHMLTHTGEKPYKCKVKKCGKAFNTSFSLKNHSYIHTNEKPFKCSFCEYACRDNSTLRKHQLRHMGIKKKFECKICNKTYYAKHRLKLHVAEYHLEVDVRKYPCQQCDKKFTTNASLKLHVKNVHKRVNACKCPICGKMATNKSNLTQHMLRHSEQRPYLCTYPKCSLRFKDRMDLKKHSRIHTPDQQHPCHTCGKVFIRERLLKYHTRTVHDKSKCVECDYCGQRFYSKSYLTNHIQRKHGRKKQKYKCDNCDFITTNKPSIVMHIKYGHGSDNDRECHICHTIYKRNVYLKLHYLRTHGIRYKTKPRPQKLEIKSEPEDDEVSIDLFEIEKEEEEATTDPTQTEEEKLEGVRVVSKNMFEDFFIQHVIMPFDEKVEKKEQNPYYKIDLKAQEDAKRSVQTQLNELKRQQAIANVERTRQIYNERMRQLVSGIGSKEEPIKVKLFNKPTKRKTKDKCNNSNNKNNSNEVNTSTDDVPRSSSKESDDEQTLEENDEIKATLNDDDDQSTNNSQNSTLKVIRKSSRPRKKKKIICDDEEPNEDDDDQDYVDEEERNNTVGKNRKVKYNTHQCYVCFKLFPTLEQLLDHCKDHFDICADKCLTKCPLCDYVSKHNTPRHLQMMHGVKIKVPYGRLKDKQNNENGCRYYFEIDNPLIEKVEVIPSLRNLNKIESMKLDKKKREEKNKTVSKTKLVRKGKEWVVEKEKIDISSAIIPKIDDSVIKSIKLGDDDSYLDGLKKIYHAEKKSGKTILFPCQHCEKICQNLSALKLHNRKHNPNKKPFKPKVYRHNLKTTEAPVKVQTVTKTENRTAKPQPIKNKHKCDPKLKEFYENNIRGGDIEFWQFLKIFNKMDRENIDDFDDLKGRYEFGIGHHHELKDITDLSANNISDSVNITDNAESSLNNNSNGVNSDSVNTSTNGLNNENKVTKKTRTNKSKINKSKITKRKRVVRLTKEEYNRRKLIRNKLRENLQVAQNVQSN